MTLSILIWLPLAIALAASLLFPPRLVGRVSAAASLVTLGVAISFIARFKLGHDRRPQRQRDPALDRAHGSEHTAFQTRRGRLNRVWLLAPFREPKRQRNEEEAEVARAAQVFHGKGK